MNRPSENSCSNSVWRRVAGGLGPDGWQKGNGGVSVLGSSSFDETKQNQFRSKCSTVKSVEIAAEGSNPNLCGPDLHKGKVLVLLSGFRTKGSTFVPRQLSGGIHVDPQNPDQSGISPSVRTQPYFLLLSRPAGFF